jgi:hypothetical protein
VTYQEEFANNVWAQAALDATWKAKLPWPACVELAWYLCAEETAGRIKHEQHRMQVASKWCKQRKEKLQ